MQNVSILILCCVVEKGIIWGFLCFIFFKNKTLLDDSWQTLILICIVQALHCAVQSYYNMKWVAFAAQPHTPQSTIEGGGSVFWDFFAVK